MKEECWIAVEIDYRGNVPTEQILHLTAIGRRRDARAALNEEVSHGETVLLLQIRRHSLLSMLNSITRHSVFVSQ